MKTTQWIKTGVVAAMMAIATACGGSKPSPETQATSTSTSTSTSTPQATPNPAQAAQQMAEAMQKATGQTQTAPAVDFEKLVALLPEPTGWTRSKPRGEQMSMGVSMSKAEASYEKGESSVRLEITDSSFNQLLLAPMSMMLMSTYSERSSEGYKKAASLNGSPGYEEWENEPKEGTVTVVVANRFVVTARGRSMDNIESVRSFVKAIDLGKLAALK